MLFVLFARTLVERHCYPDPRVLQQSQQQYWRRVPVKANRGIIQDSKGNHKDLIHKDNHNKM